MHGKPLLLAAIALALTAVACAGGGSTDPPVPQEPREPGPVPVTAELLRDGRTAYRKYCVQCHGYSGKGDGTSAAHLTPPPRDHTDAELMDAISDEVIAETVVYGGVGRGYPNMPAFPHVEGDELVALVAYVRSLSRPEVASVDISGVN